MARARIGQHRHQNVPMETRGLVADFDGASGVLTVHSANQGVSMAKMILAGQLGQGFYDFVRDEVKAPGPGAESDFVLRPLHDVPQEWTESRFSSCSSTWGHACSWRRADVSSGNPE